MCNFLWMNEKNKGKPFKKKKVKNGKKKKKRN